MDAELLLGEQTAVAIAKIATTKDSSKTCPAIFLGSTFAQKSNMPTISKIEKNHIFSKSS